MHRAQGGTVSQLYVDLAHSSGQCHIHYVALSRITSISQLYLADLIPSGIKVSPQVSQEMERLRLGHQLQFVLQDLTNFTNSIVILHQNARSLHKHILDIQNDNNLLRLTYLLSQKPTCLNILTVQSKVYSITICMLMMI